MSCRMLIGAVVTAALAIAANPAAAADAAQLSRDAQSSLQALYAQVPSAKALGAKANAILVFPKVTKAGLGVGGQFGEGALLRAANRSRTTTPRAHRSASRPAPRPTDTRCF